MKRPTRPKRTRLRAAAKQKQRPTLDGEQKKALEAKIGYKFKDDALLTRALTHPSLIDDFGGGAQFSNQRLEFLGDRVLGLIMANTLIRKYPDEREGVLTKHFHTLVSGETCARVGEQFNLRDYLFLDASMKKNQGGHYDKAVADAVEALIAAIYNDGGLQAAEAFIAKCWIFDDPGLTQKPPTNPKTALSDWCGAHQAPYAVYDVVSQHGPSHAPTFEVSAKVAGFGEATARGKSKQDAEMAAAKSLLEQLDTQ